MSVINSQPASLPAFVEETPVRGQIRQGNLLLVPVEAPAEIPPVVGEEYRLHDERSGFVHRLSCRLHEGGVLFLGRHVRLSHESHADVLVPPGWWRTLVQREQAERAVLRWD